MKHTYALFVFAVLILSANVASADTASDWWGKNCADTATADDYGVRSPVVYASVYTGVGAAENLAQVGESFTFMVRGPLKYAAELSVSDSGVKLGAKTCLSNGQPYPNCGQGEFQFKQEISIEGEPRDIVVKTTDGGVLFPGKTGPSKAVCLKIPVYRGTEGYRYSISLDKSEFASNESFKVTVDGISWLKAKDMGSQLQFSRSNAPASSCEYGPNVGAVGVVCQADSVLTCSLLPDTSKPQYLCSATMLDPTGTVRFPNKTSDVTYTVSLRNTQDLFDTYTFIGGPKTIKLLKYGQTGTTTNYGSCSDGEGINPASPQNGCTRCQNISNQYRASIATCAGVGPNAYQWTEGGPAEGFDVNAPGCTASVTIGGSCIGEGPNAQGDCQRDGKVLRCEPVGGANSGRYHGRVVNISGNGIKGATVKISGVTANALGFPNCPVTITGENGEYTFSEEQYKLGAGCVTVAQWVDVKADGFVDGRTMVGTEFDKKIPDTVMLKAGTPPMLPLTIDDGDQTMDKNTVRFVLRNAVPGKVAVCSQVINHPNLPNLNTNPATPCSDWIPASQWASGNEEWKFDASKNTLTGTFRHTAKDVNGGPVWDIPGLIVRASFKIEGTTDVVTATLRVAGGSAPKAAVPESEPAGGTASGGIGETIVGAVEAGVVAVGNLVGGIFTSLQEFVGGLSEELMSIF